nr:MAG TPA: hypothetical protein [Caudoviricetes sp.]DAY21371.1 MAG TPA: hypothetical protein [Caudoviricetes sp.]
MEGTPSKSVDLIRFYFTFFIIISLKKSPNQVAFLSVSKLYLGVFLKVVLLLRQRKKQ